MPAFVEPMRPTLAAKPFSDPAYLFELKLDGWRTLCFLIRAVIAAIAHDLIGGKGDVWRRNQRDRAERECDQ
jgi:hypothetical protein